MWTNEGPSLYWDSEKNTVVREGDPAAAFLLVAAGGQITQEEAELYGLPGTNKAKAEKAAAEKAKAAQANKLKQPPPANKGKGA